MILIVKNPFDQSVFKELAMDDEVAIETALKRAHKLFQDPTGWLPPNERMAILKKPQQL